MANALKQFALLFFLILLVIAFQSHGNGKLADQGFYAESLKGACKFDDNYVISGTCNTFCRNEGALYGVCTEQSLCKCYKNKLAMVMHAAAAGCLQKITTTTDQGRLGVAHSRFFNLNHHHIKEKGWDPTLPPIPEEEEEDDDDDDDDDQMSIDNDGKNDGKNDADVVDDKDDALMEVDAPESVSNVASDEENRGMEIDDENNRRKRRRTEYWCLRNKVMLLH